MSDNTAAAAAEVPGKVAGLAITAIVLVVIVAWIALWIGALKFTDTTLVGGFMLLWYWANNEAMDIKRLPAAIIGALVGVFLAWFVVYATITWGTNGTIAGLLLMVAALYLDVIKAVPLAVNTSTMLFLTLAAAPLIQLKVNWTELTLSIVIGGIFFGVVIEGIKRLAARAGGAQA